MLRRSISCMLAGLLGMGGLILLVILFLPGARPTPFFFFAGAGFIAAVGLIWLASEIAEGFRTGSTRQDRMAFTSAQSAAIKGLNVEDVRRRLAYAGPGRTAVVPGCGVLEFITAPHPTSDSQSPPSLTSQAQGSLNLTARVAVRRRRAP